MMQESSVMPRTTTDATSEICLPLLENNRVKTFPPAHHHTLYRPETIPHRFEAIHAPTSQGNPAPPNRQRRASDGNCLDDAHQRNNAPSFPDTHAPIDATNVHATVLR